MKRFRINTGMNNPVGQEMGLELEAYGVEQRGDNKVAIISSGGVVVGFIHFAHGVKSITQPPTTELI